MQPICVAGKNFKKISHFMIFLVELYEIFSFPKVKVETQFSTWIAPYILRPQG